MKKVDYLIVECVVDFVAWLSNIIAGTAPISFSYPTPHATQPWATLYDAQQNYAWPNNNTTINIPNPPYQILLGAISNLTTNTDVLDIIKRHLTSATTDNNFCDWAKAVMDWGFGTMPAGVENKFWIDHHRNNMLNRVNEIKYFIDTTQNDDVINWIAGNLVGVFTPIHQRCATTSHQYNKCGFRFNAGWTKVYSLLIDNFIIYDSRVAAALAWLVLQHNKNPCNEIRFGCLTAAGNRTRNPNAVIFPQIDNNPENHLIWNIRASWILEAAFNKAQKCGFVHGKVFGNLREVEAALFMIGYDLTPPSSTSSLITSSGTPLGKSTAKQNKKTTTTAAQSKKQQAIAIYNQNPSAKRSEIIKRFITEAGCTSKSASTYYHNINTGKWK